MIGDIAIGLLQGLAAIVAFVWTLGAASLYVRVEAGDESRDVYRLCKRTHPWGALFWPVLVVAIIVHVHRTPPDDRGQP